MKTAAALLLLALTAATLAADQTGPTWVLLVWTFLALAAAAARRVHVVVNRRER